MVFITQRFFKIKLRRFKIIKCLKTLEAWLDLLKEKEDIISEIFAKEYGSNKVTEQLNGWKLFYIMSRLTSCNTISNNF